MAIPKIIIDLVNRFKENSKSYTAATYNETQLRREFLDPFFETLGWDVSNKQSYAEPYKEVIHEDAIKIGTATKAPDYSFRVGGTRKFFVEAKKPFVNIKEDISPAFQLRRYAWSAKLPLSILTDFEEFAVYDCRLKPVKTDKASVGRILYMKFDEYEKRWDEISAIFSKESILRGSFDKFAETVKGKKGTSEVDDEFLAEIERWRDLLARNIAIKNPNLSQRELNFAVQRTIDRIIFLRICEDRGIEHYGTLMSLLNGENVYKRMRQNFQKADEIYNSGLFHFRDEKGRAEPPDTLTLSLQIDDKPIKDIISNMYYPESPYEFSVLPADILGQVYEQFLGKVIRLTSGHQAKVEDKPEVKKAGGVYYTPTGIVDYIVKNTVGKLIENKKPHLIEKLKILDPACGSGSFLIQAYQFLLDYHRDWYLKDGIEKHSKGKEPKLSRLLNGEWRLSTSERKKILLNNIFGVDIDSQAVEVTKLSLLLKVLEGENEQSLAQQMTLWHERALPDLENNIKCGNSLIRRDFFHGKPDSLFGDEHYRVNPFDWNQNFQNVFSGGGFDAVIGNPPYLFITELCDEDKDYFFENYKTCSYRFDVYGLFIEYAICHLLNKSGLLSFIIPHTILSNDSFESLRKLILKQCHLLEVLDIGPGVFESAKNETMIFICKNTSLSVPSKTSVIKTTAKDFPSPEVHFEVDQKDWLLTPRSSWLVNVNPELSKILNKIESASYKLGDFCTVNQGLRTGDNDKYLSPTPKSGKWKPAAGGKEVGRYEPLPDGLFVYYEPSVLDAPRKEEIFKSKRKIVVQEIRNITLPRRIVATLDENQFFCLQSTNVINLREKPPRDFSLLFLLGFINSSAANFFFKNRFSGNNHIASNQLAQIPIPDCSQADHDHIVHLVNTIIKATSLLAKSHSPSDSNLLIKEIASVNIEIDSTVCKLFGIPLDSIERPS
jgi:type I restriction-modification system DNA methylase subunit